MPPTPPARPASPADLLVGLAELAAHHGPAVLARKAAASAASVAAGPACPPRRATRVRGSAASPANRHAPGAATCRGGKPSKQNRSLGSARHGERGGHGRWAGQHGHPQPGGGSGGDQPVSGVAHPGHARVGDQRHVVAGPERGQQPRHPGPARRRRSRTRIRPAGCDAERGGQPAHPAGVLGRDDGRLRPAPTPAGARASPDAPMGAAATISVPGPVSFIPTVHVSAPPLIRCGSMVASRTDATKSATRAWNAAALRPPACRPCRAAGSGGGRARCW